jgi:MinD superfamily P-loop ATPase
MNRTVSLHIDYDLCQACQRCKASQACRLKAILQVDPGEEPYLDVERCRDCRVCIPACPHGAVTLNR